MKKRIANFDRFKKINETGEWSKDVDLGFALDNTHLDGEDEEVSWILGMYSDLSDIESVLGKDVFKIQDIKGFDKYQGPYASVTILGKRYKIWSQDADGSYFVENFEISNTEEHENDGFVGDTFDIIEVIKKLKDGKLNESSKFVEEVENLFGKMENKISDLVSAKGEESEFYSDLVIKIDDDELNFNLDTHYDGYVVEVSINHLISNKGNIYSFDLLSITDLAELVDYMEIK